MNQDSELFDLRFFYLEYKSLTFFPPWPPSLSGIKLRHKHLIKQFHNGGLSRGFFKLTIGDLASEHNKKDRCNVRTFDKLTIDDLAGHYDVHIPPAQKSKVYGPERSCKCTVVDC